MVFYKSKRWSIAFLLISTLILLSILTLAGRSLTSFYEYKKSVDPQMELTLGRFHFFITKESNYEWMKLRAPTPLSDDESVLQTFHLTVDQEDIDTLNSDLPRSGKEQYVDAYLKESNDDKIRKIKLRYRGDSNYHWLYPQKSLRIKLAKNDIYNMEKKFNLINPPGMISYRDIINYEISKKLGLITPDYYPVRVFINGKYMGLYMYLSQVDESLIRKYKKMPGSIYFGEGAPANKDGISDLWFNEKYWDKQASRNSEQKENRDDITFFINAINNYSDEEFENFVETYLNKEMFFKFIAMDRLFGSHHHAYSHNHKIYFDPYVGKFEPISWDLRFWLPFEVKDLSLYPLQLRLTSVASYDAEVDKIVYELISENVVNTVRTRYQNIIDDISQDLKSDTYKDTATKIPALFKKPISVPFTLDDITSQKNKDIGVFEKRVKFLSKIINESNIEFHLDELSNNMYKLVVNISGNSPARIEFPTLMHEIKLKIDHKMKRLEKGLLIYPGRKIDDTQKQFSKWEWGSKRVENSNNTYVFLLQSKASVDQLLSDISFVNDITNLALKPKVKRKGHYLQSITSISETAQEKIILDGVIGIDKTIVYDKKKTIVIKPGTKFLMSENASIYFYGKVEALGTKDKPIKFMAKDNKKPWGLIAVQGKATTGSKFEYVEIMNGSLDSRNLIHYTAPFNIHDTDWFEVRHCKIGANFVGDDSMHVAYAKGIIDNSEFINARSDGLDIDISDVTVTNNIFYKSGNDGLDIMTTTMKASNNVFIDSGDKGISVGEWSTATITDSLFLRTAIGLEVKDKSEVNADNLIIVDSKNKAINLYNKNNRYDEGGFIDAKTIYLLGNDKITSDERSTSNIENIINGQLPPLDQFQWYANIHNKSYFNDIKSMGNTNAK